MRPPLRLTVKIPVFRDGPITLLVDVTANVSQGIDEVKVDIESVIDDQAGRYVCAPWDLSWREAELARDLLVEAYEIFDCETEEARGAA